jgi:Domain of unknown function (DUF4836)
MRRNLLLPFSVVAFLLILASCSNKDKSGLPVPKDAGMVLHINTPSLASKISWEEIKNSQWFKEMSAQSSPDSLAQKLLSDPASSGINTQADMVFFTRRRGKGGYVVFEGSISNATAFEAFSKEVMKAGAAKKEGDLSVLANSNDKEAGIVAWKDDRFTYVFDAPAMNMGDRYSNPEGQRYGYDSLVAFAKELSTLKSDNSLASDKKYTSLISEAGDIHMWANAENLYGGMLNDMLSMMKAGVLIEGSITTSTINFDNGKITMNVKGYYNDEIGKVYEKHRMKNIDAEAFNRIPAQNVVAAFAMNYPPDGLKDFMKAIGVDGWVNSTLGDLGYSVDEFVKANKGDIMFTVSDFTLNKQQVTIPSDEEGGQPHVYTTTKPDVKVLFATSINDKPSFDKLVSVLKGKLGDMSEGGGMPKITYSSNDKWFAAGNSPEQVNGFLSGTGAKQAFVSKISGHPAGFYVDLHKIFEISAAAEDSTSSTKMMFGDSMNMWEDIICTGGEIKDGAFTGTFEVNLVDKKTNSLKQLNQYFDRLNANRKKGF